MISKSQMSSIVFLLALLSVGVADAKTYTLSPNEGHSNQDQINEALRNGNVYLNAGVYDVDNTIIIGSNRVLSGDSNAIIRVYSDSSQWFTGLKGVISCEGVVSNVEISGFQIDGNIGKLPKSYADSRSDTSHDCEKLIILHGYSASFASNIKIHDLKLYNSFSDGIYILFADKVACYNNVISNCQHEGIYLSCIKNGLFYSNNIAGITSDCGRLDNCVDCKVYGNLFVSYTGESYGAWAGGQSGLQIADAGASHGYDGSNKPQSTTNIEVYDNTFSSPGQRAVWLDSTGKGVTNVYIHDNKFVGVSGIETDGTSVDVDGVSVEGISFDNVSVENPPTVEMSEKVFSSIFDFLNMKVYTQVGANDTVILPEGIKESSSKALGTIEYHTVGNNTTTFVSIPQKYLQGVSEVQYEINGVKETHTLMIGERTKYGVVFTEANAWDGNLPHEGRSLKLTGKVNPDDIKVKCITPKGEFNPDFKTKTVTFKPLIIHPAVIILFIVIMITILFLRLSLRHMI